MISFDVPGDAIKRTTNVVAATSDYTCIFWWRYNSTSASRYAITIIDAPGTYLDWIEFFAAGDFLTLSLGLAGVETPSTSYATVAGTLYPVAYVREGDEHRFYIDGVLFDTVTLDIATATFGEIWLGDDGFTNDSDQSFMNFREWSQALTTAEVLAELGSSIPIVTTDLETDTPLNNDLLDNTPNNNDWTLVGADTFLVAAQRVYPSVQATSIRIDGPYQGVWQMGDEIPWYPYHWTWQLKTVKVDAGQLSEPTFECNQQGNYDFPFYRWITEPLEAQPVFDGSFNFCFRTRVKWSDRTLGLTNDSIARWKIHIYITNGQTSEVRHVLIDNYVNNVNLPNTYTWSSLNGTVSVNAGAIAEGDCIVVELGVRIVSSPTPVPLYPPEDFTVMEFRGRGTNQVGGTPYTDAVAGDTVDTLAPWFEFSRPLVFLPAPAPPANDACADAIVVTTAPYTSDFICTTSSADTNRRVWWKFTAPATGNVFVHTYGSNYRIDVDVFTGTCGGLTPIVGFGTVTRLSPNLSRGYIVFDAISGTDYYIAATNFVGSTNAPNSGGSLKLSIVYQRDPIQNDLYLPDADLLGFSEDGTIFNIRAMNEALTGVAIDYTQRVMDEPFNGGTSTGYRILIGLHDFELVEIFDLNSLNFDESEVDFIADPFTGGGSPPCAQLYITEAGILYAGWFGNGYLYVAGEGALPAILNTISDNTDDPAIKVISAVDADNQPGAPFPTATRIFAAPNVTAPWALTIDEENEILYYTSGGYYVPVGGQTIKRWDLANNVQMADFTTIPGRGINAGLKGLTFLRGGGLLVCNGDAIHRLNSSGTIVQTFTSSNVVDSQCFVDIKVVADGQSFWAIDQASTRFFKFDLATGAELTSFLTYAQPGGFVQMAIFQPGGLPPEPPEPPITSASFSGIYKLVPGKRNDTVWIEVDTQSTLDIKIPDPFIKTGMLGS